MSPFKKFVYCIGALSLLRLFVASSFELSTDEGYYWLWSEYLSMSYYDHPPMVALMIALTTLFGDGELFIRLGPIISVALTSWLLYRLAEELYDDPEGGFHAVWLANLTLVLSVGALVATPDAPLIVFYTAALLAFWKSAGEEPGTVRSYGIWALTGLLAGCAMLSKYTGVFFFPCGLLFLALMEHRRRWFARPEPYLAALVAFVVFLPVLLWNAEHDWISFAKQAGHGLAPGAGKALEYFGEFIGLQILLYSVGIFFFLIASTVTMTRSGFDSRRMSVEREAPLFLFCFSVPLLLFFAWNGFRTQVEGNWPVLGFIPLFVQAGVMVPGWQRSPKVRRWFGASVGLAVVMWGVLHIQVVDPVIPHPQRYEISRRIFGWKLLASQIDEARAQSPTAFLISNRHQVGSLMTYYTAPHITAYLLGTNNVRLTYLPPVDTHIGEDAFYLTQKDRDHREMIEPLFDRMEKIGDTDIVRKGELIRQFVLYRCYNYHGGLEKI